MPTLLQIDSSPRLASVSNRLTAAFVDRWKRKNLAGTIFHHNTTLEKLPFVDGPTAEALLTPHEALTTEQKQLLTLSDQLIDELLAADMLVLGVPMWNLGIPASLKAWIDLIVREGRSFAFTDTGVVSLLPMGKKAYVFTARGGSYAAGSALAAFDQQEPYLRTLLGFLGFGEVRFIHAENQSGDEAARAAGLAYAMDELAALTA